MCGISVVVIGGLHHNTLGVVRALGEAGVAPEGIHVLIVGEGIQRKNLITSSKYVMQQHVDFVSSYDKITEWLISLSTDGVRRVIICCSDGAAESVMLNADRLSKMYDCPSVKGNISELMQKNEQGRIAQESGLVIPDSTVISKMDEIVWDYFPCIIKPIKSVLGAGKADIRILYSTEELENAVSSIESDRLQIQQYIQKELEYQLIGCSLDGGEKIIIPGFTRIIRQPKNTNTGYLEYNPIKNFIYNKEAVETFIKEIGYSGLFSLEFIRGEDGRDYFLEINLRNDGNAYCVTTAGINLPYIWCYYQVKRVMPDVPMEFDKSIRFIPDFNDLKIAKETDGLIQWCRDFLFSESHSIFNLKDLRPFFIEIGRLMKK